MSLTRCVKPKAAIASALPKGNIKLLSNSHGGCIYHVDIQSTPGIETITITSQTIKISKRLINYS